VFPAMGWKNKSEIEKAIRKDGLFVPKSLQKLNPDQLGS
jgi:hypothetical protein